MSGQIYLHEFRFIIFRVERGFRYAFSLPLSWDITQLQGSHEHLSPKPISATAGAMAVLLSHSQSLLTGISFISDNLNN